MKVSGHDADTMVVGTNVTKDDSPAAPRRRLGYVMATWLLVAGFALVTVGWSYHVGVSPRDPNGWLFMRRLPKAAGLFVFLALLDAAWRTYRTGWSLEALFTTLHHRWPVRRLVLALSGLVAYHLVYLCYRNMKNLAAFNDLHDDVLLRLDRWLFLGHDPAVLLHDLLGTNTSAFVLVFFYRSFTYLVPIFVVGALVFADRIRQGYVALVAAMWMWVLGIVAYYLIPSLGPFASEPEVFSVLPATKVGATQDFYLDQRALFLADPGGEAFVSIGAFASLHVGLTCMAMLMLRYYGLRRASWVAAGYLAVTVAATIYLGWHYVLDDVAGVALAVLAVSLARRMVDPRERSVRPEREGVRKRGRSLT